MDNNLSIHVVFLLVCKRHLIVLTTILLHKPDHYTIRRISNNWFRSHLTGSHSLRTQIGTMASEKEAFFYVGSIVGPRLCFIHKINVDNTSSKNLIAIDIYYLLTNAQFLLRLLQTMNSLLLGKMYESSK